MKSKIGKLGKIGDVSESAEYKFLTRVINEIIEKQGEIIDHLNSQDQEEYIEKWNKNEIKKRDILVRDVLDNGFDTTYTTATAKQMEVETDILLRKRFLMEVISSLESTLRSIKCGEDCGFERTIIELLEDMGYGNLYSMLPKRLKILSSEDWANFNKNIDNITV